MRFLNVSGAFLAVTIAGCVVSSLDVEAPGESERVEAAEAAIKPRGIETVPAYFNYDNHYAPADGTSFVHAHFNSNPGKRIQVVLRQGEGVKEAAIGFKLYRVLRDGRIALIETVDGPRGVASHAFQSRSPGSYVVQLASSGRLSDLVLSLSCNGGNCSPERQPGEYCGGFTRGPIPACAEGLFCSYKPGDSCGWADAPGSCAVKPDACAAEYKPVCGCNGQTYPNACAAAAGATGILHEGECEGEAPR